VVDEPTIIPAALVPFPATLFAVLVLPPKVPKSVTVKLGWPLANVNPVRKTQTAARRIIVFMGARGETPPYKKIGRRTRTKMVLCRNNLPIQSHRKTAY